MAWKILNGYDTGIPAVTGVTFVFSLLFRFVAGLVSFVAGAEVLKKRLRILIVGHSFIFWAVRHAAKSPWGSNLRLGASAQLEWFGERYMQWDAFLHAVPHGPHSCLPNVLVLHLVAMT